MSQQTTDKKPSHVLYLSKEASDQLTAILAGGDAEAVAKFLLKARDDANASVPSVPLNEAN